jgi:hypothetical protein
MTATSPCRRHPRGVWTVACPDCTTWHVEIALARCRPETTDVPSPAPRPAA